MLVQFLEGHELISPKFESFDPAILCHDGVALEEAQVKMFGVFDNTFLVFDPAGCVLVTCGEEKGEGLKCFLKEAVGEECAR